MKIANRLHDNHPRQTKILVKKKEEEEEKKTVKCGSNRKLNERERKLKMSKPQNKQTRSELHKARRGHILI
jgi:hypothetical protein